MPQFQHFSLEELRWDDTQIADKQLAPNATMQVAVEAGAPAQPAAAAPAFGSFGAPAAAAAPATGFGFGKRTCVNACAGATLTATLLRCHGLHVRSTARHYLIVQLRVHASARSASVRLVAGPVAGTRTALHGRLWLWSCALVRPVQLARRHYVCVWQLWRPGVHSAHRHGLWVRTSRRVCRQSCSPWCAGSVPRPARLASISASAPASPPTRSTLAQARTSCASFFTFFATRVV
jgi:hypothetical protein